MSRNGLENELHSNIDFFSYSVNKCKFNLEVFRLSRKVLTRQPSGRWHRVVSWVGIDVSEERTAGFSTRIIVKTQEKWKAYIMADFV
jgi:hypothetical protein